MAYAEMLLIFSPENSSRLQYALQLIFNTVLGIKYEFTTDLDRFLSCREAKLNYSGKKISDESFVHAESFLFEKGIKDQAILGGSFQGIKTIFSHRHPSDLPFDPFAAAFYLVSRYEEYLPYEADEHGRFPAEASLNFKNGFLDIPVVNHYALFLKQLIQSRYPNFLFPGRKYRFQLTYDIDMAFEFREKGAMRNTGGYLRSLKNLNLREISLRTRVLLGQADDPFDTFSFQDLLHEKYSLNPLYFFLLGDHSMYDKNIQWRNKFFSETVKGLSEKYETGIHASYESNRFPEKLKKEKKRLETITGKNVFRNRQHFLKLQFPNTYRNLLKAGISEDYSMGYSSQIGFRAGIAEPFHFYDLQKEQVTDLLVFPFAVMDATLHYYLRLSPAAALEKSKTIVDQVKNAGGLFIFLAHNDLISDDGPFRGWRDQFDELLKYAGR